MNVVLVYNKHSKADRELISELSKDGKFTVTPIELNDLQEEIRSLVRATPAMFISPKHYQGEFITKTDNSALYALGEIMKNVEVEETIAYNQPSQKVDALILAKQEEAVDALTIELLEGGTL